MIIERMVTRTREYSVTVALSLRLVYQTHITMVHTTITRFHVERNGADNIFVYTHIQYIITFMITLIFYLFT